MITNERQYRITRNKAARLCSRDRGVRREGRTNVPACTLGWSRPSARLWRASWRTCSEELAEYERLKSADLSVISVASFDDLAEGLDQGQDRGGAQPARRSPNASSSRSSRSSGTRRSVTRPQATSGYARSRTRWESGSRTKSCSRWCRAASRGWWRRSARWG